VVFYDYDELSWLGDCSFRRFPEARDEYEEMAAEPWFSVRDSDVFPEEMKTFLDLKGEQREIFVHHHSDLFEVEYWHSMKMRNQEGEVIDFFPYSQGQRLGARGQLRPRPLTALG
jgi:isocitrate dehydrogenase kinase/phosphatase